MQIGFIFVTIQISNWGLYSGKYGRIIYGAEPVQLFRRRDMAVVAIFSLVSSIFFYQSA